MSSTTLCSSCHLHMKEKLESHYMATYHIYCGIMNYTPEIVYYAEQSVMLFSEGYDICQIANLLERGVMETSDAVRNFHFLLYIPLLAQEGDHE